MKKSIRLIAGVGLGVIAAACTAGDDLLPPGGQVTVSYLSIGTSSESAGVYAYFLSDFVANDPADDPSVNPYADLGEGDCVAPIQAGSGNSQYTYADPGGVTLSGPETVNLVYDSSGGAVAYSQSIDPASFPFAQFFSVELAGSTEIPSTVYNNALATGDQIGFTAPTGMTGDIVNFADNTDLTFTYNTTLSEIMIISITDGSGANGLMCRVDPGDGSAEDFIIPAADVASLPANGVIVAFTYNFRDDVVNVNGEDRNISFVGQTIRVVPYAKN